VPARAPIGGPIKLIDEMRVASLNVLFTLRHGAAALYLDRAKCDSDRGTVETPSWPTSRATERSQS
jgi:hypothetical protein